MSLRPLMAGETVMTSGRTVGERDINAFAGLIGDFTPIHVDEVFARSTPFGARIAHGTLTVATATGLLTQTGVLGERVLGLLNLNWDFLWAVKIGDTIRARVTVEELRPTRKPGRSIAAFRFEVINQEETTVQRGRMLVLVRSE